MDKITHCINHNRFIPIDQEELTALELIGKTVEKTNEVVEKSNNHEDRITENENKKVSFDDMENKYKMTYENGTDYRGKWFGLDEPTLSDEGMRGQVEKNRDDILKHTEQLDNIVQQNSNFEYEVKDIKLVGQGALTDVEVLMLKDFSNNRREYGLGVEINANGSVGSLVTQDDMGHKVALYGSATTGTTGKPFIWSLNTLAQVDKGLAENAIVQGYELDVNNNQDDRYGAFDWNNGMCGGLNITSGGAYPITFGARIGGSKATNVPYYGLLIDGTKEVAVDIRGNNKTGLDLRRAIFTTGNAIVLNNEQKITVYDNSTYEYTPVLRFLDKHTLIHTRGGGFAVCNKDGSKFLFEVKENGEVSVPTKLTTTLIETSELKINGKNVTPTISGDNTQMPVNPIVGQMYFNKTKGIPLWWNGVGWVNANGQLPS